MYVTEFAHLLMLYLFCTPVSHYEATLYLSTRNWNRNKLNERVVYAKPNGDCLFSIVNGCRVTWTFDDVVAPYVDT